MLSMIFYAFSAVVSCVFVHVLGHTIMAAAYGKKLDNFRLGKFVKKFKLNSADIEITTYGIDFDIPEELTDEQKKTIVISGFMAECFFGILLLLINSSFSSYYTLAFLFHILYCRYINPNQHLGMNNELEEN